VRRRVRRRTRWLDRKGLGKKIVVSLASPLAGMHELMTDGSADDGEEAEMEMEDDDD